MLAGLGAPWNTLQARGHAGAVHPGPFSRMDRRPAGLAGQAQFDATGHLVAPVDPQAHGQLPHDTQRRRATPTLLLDTLEGSLQLSGSGQWVGSRLHFNGEASAAPEREAALSNLLNIIGRRNGARSHHHPGLTA